jgi:hypothetical protein
MAQVPSVLDDDSVHTLKEVAAITVNCTFFRSLLKHFWLLMATIEQKKTSKQRVLRFFDFFVIPLGDT